jgi:hypothetical protein
MIFPGGADVSDDKPLITKIAFEHQLQPSDFVAGNPKVSQEQHVWPMVQNKVRYTVERPLQSSETNVEVANHQRVGPEALHCSLCSSLFSAPQQCPR